MSDSLIRAVRESLSTLLVGTRVVCALSGGADSVAMTHCVMRLAPTMGLEAVAAHYNHHLRGAESDRDEAFVRDLCARWDLPLTVGGGIVANQGGGIEDAARQLRYVFLREAAGAGVIATAHTMDDQAETVLLQLIRGTGLKGLGGIAPQRGGLIRPLLEVRRADVMNYLAVHGLPHVEDSSNTADDYRRNRVRHQLLPLLTAENPRMTESLAELARQSRAEEALLSEMTRQALESCVADGALCCDRLQAQPDALQSRILRAFCGMELSARHTTALRGLCCNCEGSGSVSLPEGWTAVRTYERLRLERGAPEKWGAVVLSVPGVCEVPGWRIECEKSTAPVEISQFSYTFYLSHDTITGDVMVRPRTSGDMLRLPGGSRSLKRLMIDRKLPARERDMVPVLADEAGVLAVPGLAVDAERQAKPGFPAWRITVTRIREDGDR